MVDVGRPATGLRLAERALHAYDRANNAGSAARSHGVERGGSKGPHGVAAAGATTDNGSDTLRARILLVMADALVELGQIAEATEVLERAAQGGPAVQPLVQASRGVLLGRTGRMREAQRELDAAIATYRDGSRPGGTLLRMLHWRGLLHLTEGRPELAQIDCEQARDLGQALGLDASVTIATHNIGLAKFYGGDLPGALVEMTKADEVAPEVRVGFRALDRARVLLAAGLSAEAREFADKARRAFAAERSRVDLAEALLVQAEIDLIAGFPHTSRLAARRSARIYLASGHTRGVLAARLMEVRADAQERVTSRRSVARRAIIDAARAEQVAADLERAGLADDARAARLLQTDALLEANDLAGARAAATAAGVDGNPRGARGDRRAPTLAIEMHSHLVAARLDLAEGRRSTGLTHIRRGLDDLAAFQARFGSQDLQAASAVHGRELTLLGLSTALDTRSPAAILQWLERSRGASTRLAAVRPSADRELARELGALRTAMYLSLRATRSGNVDPGLESTVKELRHRVRSRSWAAGGTGAVSRPFSLAEVQRRLAQTSPRVSVVAPFRGKGRFHALVITATTARYMRLAPDPGLNGMLHRVIEDLNVLADHRIRRPLRMVAEHSLNAGLAAAARLIVDPVQPYVDDGPVVIAAAGAAAIVPWALLPGLSGRAISVTASVTAAIASLGQRGQDHRHGVLAVAGPEVPSAVTEASNVAAAYPSAVLLTGAQATGRAVLDSMPQGGLLHIAAHGHHETENPLFSGVMLADGLLYGYDVAPNPVLPAQVVLSSCDVGKTDDRPGGEPLGLVAALLRSGVSTVIAGTSRISDAVAAMAMTAYHDRLRTGVPPAIALADAIKSVAELDEDPAPFTCFGAGI